MAVVFSTGTEFTPPGSNYADRGHEILCVSDCGTFTFVNGSTARSAGEVVVLNHAGTVPNALLDVVAVLKRNVAANAVGEAHLLKPRKIMMGSVTATGETGAADIAVGVALTLATGTNILEVGVPNGTTLFGVFISLPRPGGVIDAASGAAASGGAPVIYFCEL